VLCEPFFLARFLDRTPLHWPPQVYLFLFVGTTLLLYALQLFAWAIGSWLFKDDSVDNEERIRTVRFFQEIALWVGLLGVIGCLQGAFPARFHP